MGTPTYPRLRLPGRVVHVISATCLALAVMACGGEAESTQYVQTWTKAYGDTTCAEYVVEMTDHQRMIMAGDMLIRLWRNEDADARIPTDDEMTSFAAAIGIGCAEETGDALTPTEVAVYLYTLGDGFRPG